MSFPQPSAAKVSRNMEKAKGRKKKQRIKHSGYKTTINYRYIPYLYMHKPYKSHVRKTVHVIIKQTMYQKYSITYFSFCMYVVHNTSSSVIHTARTLLHRVSFTSHRLVPTQPPIQWVPGHLSPGIKCGQCMMLTTHPLLVPRLRKSRSYNSSHPNVPLWSITRPVYL
jgi:hypothetical protein